MNFNKKYDITELCLKRKGVRVMSMKITKKILSGALAVMNIFTTAGAVPINNEKLPTAPAIKKDEKSKSKLYLKLLDKILTAGTVIGFAAGCFYEFYECMKCFECGEDILDIILYCYSIPEIRKNIEDFKSSSENEKSIKMLLTIFFKILDSGKNGYFDKNSKPFTGYYKFYAICHNLEKSIYGFLKCENLEKIISDTVKQCVYSKELNSQFFLPQGNYTVNMDTLKDTLSIYLKVNLFNEYAFYNDITGISKEGGRARYELRSIILHSSCGEMPEVWKRTEEGEWVKGAYTEKSRSRDCLRNRITWRCCASSMHLIYKKMC